MGAVAWCAEGSGSNVGPGVRARSRKRPVTDSRWRLKASGHGGEAVPAWMVEVVLQGSGTDTTWRNGSSRGVQGGVVAHPAREQNKEGIRKQHARQSMDTRIGKDGVAWP